MTIKEIANRIKGIPKISVNDPEHAADEIAPKVIKKGILFYSNRIPAIKKELHYQRISSTDAEAIVSNLLDDKSRMIVPSKEIKETLKRLCYAPELQVDLEEEFWKGQMFVNLTHGIYDILKQELVPIRGEIMFDYVINIYYRPRCKLDDAPNFKHYIESSVGMSA